MNKCKHLRRLMRNPEVAMLYFLVTIVHLLSAQLRNDVEGM